MSAVRRRLRSSCEGSIFVELIVITPLLALIWLGTHSLFELNVARIDIQRDTRLQAWTATRGCQGAGEPVDDSRLRAQAQGGFETMARVLPFLSGSLRELHGREQVVERSAPAPAPAALGGTRTVSGAARMMCNDRPRPWTLPEVFEQTCRQLIAARCQ